MDIYDKIHIELKNNRLTKAQLADFIGISREHFTRIFGKKDLSNLQLMKASEFFKNHNIDILESKIITPDKSDITSLRKSKSNGSLLVPYYEVDFYAGNSSELLDNAITPAYYMDISEFKGCTAFRAYSDSMENLIHFFIGGLKNAYLFAYQLLL